MYLQHRLKQGGGRTWQDENSQNEQNEQNDDGDDDTGVCFILV